MLPALCSIRPPKVPALSPAARCRAIFDVMGIRNIVAKSHGSSNPYNMVRATLDALSKLRSPSEIAAKRGKTVEELIG